MPSRAVSRTPSGQSVARALSRKKSADDAALPAKKLVTRASSGRTSSFLSALFSFALLFIPFVACFFLGKYDQEVLKHFGKDGDRFATWLLEYVIVLPGILLSTVGLLAAADDTVESILDWLYNALDIKIPFLGRLLTDILTVVNICTFTAFGIGVSIFVQSFGEPAKVPEWKQAKEMWDAGGSYVKNWTFGFDPNDYMLGWVFNNSIGQALADPFGVVGSALFTPLGFLRPYSYGIIPDKMTERNLGLFAGGVSCVTAAFLFLLSGPQHVKRFVMFMGALTLVAAWRNSPFLAASSFLPPTPPHPLYRAAQCLFSTASRGQVLIGVERLLSRSPRITSP